jgi:hypothetical protein
MSSLESTGTIHDQGYQRYQGARLPQSRRFLVIARNVMAVAWKSRWGVKLPILGSVIALVVSAGIMIAFDQLDSRLHGQAGQLLRADAVLYRSYVWAFSTFGAILAATVATAAIADDLKSGSFQFYFSRPLHADDYVRGKLLGLFTLVGCATFAGPVTLAVIRVCLADDFAQAMKLLPVLPKAMLLGLAGTTSMVLPAMGLGALMGRRIAAQAAYIVYWIVVSGIAAMLAHGLHQPAIALVSLASDVDAVGSYLFGVLPDPGTPAAWQAALAIVAFAVAGYAAVRARLRSASTAGIGGV